MTTAEAVRTINYEHNSCYFDEKQQLKIKHDKAIFYKHSFITTVRRVVKERTVNAQEIAKELNRDDQTATNKYAIHKRLSEQSKQRSVNLTQQVQDLRD